MPSECITRWHEFVATSDLEQLDNLLSEDVVFYSPVVHTPQRGRSITAKYLAAAMEVLVNDSWQYVSETSNDHQAVLEFVTEIDGIEINGVDIISWNEQNLIVEFKVLVRPLQAINLVHEKMAERLAGRPKAQ